MAKVLFVIRLPAHEKDLKGKHNDSFEETFQDELKRNEDRNENCKAPSETDETENCLKDDGTCAVNKTLDSNKTDIHSKSGCNEIESKERSEDNGWDFGDNNESEGSMMFSTAESSPSRTPEDKIEGAQVPPADVGEEVKSEISQGTAEDEQNKQESKKDLEYDISDISVKSESLSKKREDKTEKENVNTKKDDTSEKISSGGEKIDQSHPEYVRFLSEEMTLLERAKSVLDRLNVTGVQWSITEDNIHNGMFIAGDGAECEEILNRLSLLRIGIVKNSSVSIFPATISVASVQGEEEAVHLQDELEKEDKLKEKVEEFKKTIKSKLVIQEVIKNVEADAVFSFDYLMLIVLASLVALLGLLEASSVVLVASMLISPLMGPILAGVLGTVIRNMSLLNLGIRSELKGLAICIAVGFVIGLIPAGLEAAQLDWRSSDSWPTTEMSSRGALRAIPVGVMIAIPSGAGVALSVLGGKIGSLVGVAISASLLPPAVNAGLLWANALLVAFIPPASEKMVNMSRILSNETLVNSEDRYGYAFATSCPSLVDNAYTQHYFCNMAAESAMLGVISLFLTLLNILCIILMGVVVLKIKEVAPLPSAPDVEQEFYGKTMKIARASYQTAKGESSLILRDQFLQIYKNESGIVDEELIDNAKEELDQIMEAVEKSPDVNELLHRFPFRYNRWSSFWNSDLSSASNAVDRPYKTVNLGRDMNGQGDHVATSSDVELRQLRRRNSDQTLLSTNPAGNKMEKKEAASNEDEGDSSYFTIHRYIPPGQMRSGLMSPRRASGAFFSNIVIPKVSRFQIAKVPESDKQRAKGTRPLATMSAIREQEATPLLENKTNLPV